MLLIIQQPDITVLGLRIQEPVTCITDILIAIVCLYAFWRLVKLKTKSKTVLYMKWYFLCMGIATFLGGIIGHGFQYVFDEHWKLFYWYISMFAIMFIERASIEHAKKIVNPNLHRFLLMLNIVELLVLMTLAHITLQFGYVEFHSAYGLLGVVLILHLIIYKRTKNIVSQYFIKAIGMLIIALFIFNIPLVPHVWFNHEDLSHVLMILSTILFLKGTKQIQKYEL